MLSDPFWGHLLSGIPKRLVTGSVPVSWGIEEDNLPSLYLCIEANSWSALDSDELKKAYIQHELLHLLFHHPLDAHHFHFAHLFDLACDWIIENLKLNNRSLGTKISLADIGISTANPTAQVDMYYRALEQFWLTQIQSASPHPSLQKLEEYKNSPACHAHSAWHQVIARLSQAEKDIIRAGIDQLVSSTVERVGLSAIAHWPAALRLLLEDRQPHYRPVVDWRRVLRLFAGRHKKTYLKNTLRRPSKRYGTTPGIRIQQQQNLLVVLDTSASIQAVQFDCFFSEIYQLWRLGARIHVVECDTEIRRDYPYSGQRPAFVEGRGGSSFDPPIRWANETFQPDAILYFPDGDAPKLQLKSRFPLIWLLTAPKSKKWEQDQGISVELSLS